MKNFFIICSLFLTVHKGNEWKPARKMFPNSFKHSTECRKDDDEMNELRTKKNETSLCYHHNLYYFIHTKKNWNENFIHFFWVGWHTISSLSHSLTVYRHCVRSLFIYKRNIAPLKNVVEENFIN